MNSERDLMSNIFKSKKSMAVIIPIAVVLVLAVAVLGTGIGLHNRFVGLEEKTKTAKAEVMSRLQQRHDKMAQIVAAVEGLQDHAEDIYEMITEARAAYTAAQTTADYAEADALEALALTQLLAVVEDNPDITASSAYYAYIDEVSAMENALAVARRDFNNSVNDYNTAAKKFPGSVIVSMFGFERELEYWKVDDGATEVPIVDFTG